MWGKWGRRSRGGRGARALIEMPANAEKGFSHRFLWFFPSPSFEGFSILGEVNSDFVNKLSKRLTDMYS